MAELQRLKTHPYFVPKLTFLEEVLIGYSVRFVNVSFIKPYHNYALLGFIQLIISLKQINGRSYHNEVIEIETTWHQTAIRKDLYNVCNVKLLFSKYDANKMNLDGFDMRCQFLFNFLFFRTLPHEKPDNKLTFNRLISVFLANNNYEENQPVSVKITFYKLIKNNRVLNFFWPSIHYYPANVDE